jgi:hypothetical protein
MSGWHTKIHEKIFRRRKKSATKISRVADPHSFQPDPDPDPPAFQAEYRSGSGSNPDPGLNDQKFKKKITAEKKIKVLWIKNYNIPIPRPPLRTSNILKKPSALKRGHPTLQNMEFFNFFLLLWVRIPNPDPLTLLNPDPIRIRIRNPENKTIEI